LEPDVFSYLGPLTGLLAVFLTIALLAAKAGKQDHRRQDLVMAFGLLAWMFFMIWQARFASEPLSSLDEFIEHMSYQFCVAAAAGLALMGAAGSGSRLLAVWLLQAIGGGLVLGIWAWSGIVLWFGFWEKMNLIILGAVLLVVLFKRQRAPALHSTSVTVLSVLLLLYCLSSEVWHHPQDALPLAGLFIYPCALVGLWWMLSDRMRKQSRLAAQASFRTEVTSVVQATERRQIAQEVHDGVGSHLVSILSSLDQQNPEHRTLALSLEQCLLDLKFTVDSIQPEELTLAEGLGSLRHRIQPSLDRNGVRLRWDMGDEPAMDDMAPLTVRHALRIAQEAISNAIRHSGATELVISCQCTPALDRVELCIQDNGSGMSLASVETQAGGRGLAGMRRRAAEVMGVLDVTSEPGSGTRVFLSVPCGRTEVKTHQPIVEG